VIPNALDVALFSPANRDPSFRKSTDSGRNELTILHVGHLNRVKGIEILAQAIPQVLKEIPHASFVFVGGDLADETGMSWRQRLRSYFREKSVAERVSFPGAVDQVALLGWYARADIAVVPAILYESFSYTCAQALASGLSVVASRIGGIPETIAEGVDGILVSPGNVQELANGIICLARDPDRRKRMGQAGRVKALKKFDAIVVAKQFLEIARPLVTVSEAENYA